MADWLDIIPAIPLARGVPVKVRFITGWEDGIVLDPTGGRGGEPLVDVGYDRVSTYSSETPIRFRVDLDDPQGFAYGLQLLAQHHGRSMGDDYGDVIMRSLWGNTTDEDRLVLAQALKETIDV